MAAVLAHELSHLDDPRAFNGSGLSTAERLAIEMEADARAVELLEAGGFDVGSLEEMVMKLKDEQPAGWAERRREGIRE